MKIQTILESIGLTFKVIDESRTMEIINLPKKLHICFISQPSNQFIIDRETFEYLDLNSLPYCFLLHDSTQHKYYLLELKKENNWVKSCFNSCAKEQIYLGKQVLNAQIEYEELKNKLGRYK